MEIRLYDRPMLSLRLHWEVKKSLKLANGANSPKANTQDQMHIPYPERWSEWRVVVGSFTPLVANARGSLRSALLVPPKCLTACSEAKKRSPYPSPLRLLPDMLICSSIYCETLAQTSAPAIANWILKLCSCEHHLNRQLRIQPWAIWIMSQVF